LRDEHERNCGFRFERSVGVDSGLCGGPDGNGAPPGWTIDAGGAGHLDAGGAAHLVVRLRRET